MIKRKSRILCGKVRTLSRGMPGRKYIELFTVVLEKMFPVQRDLFFPGRAGEKSSKDKSMFVFILLLLTVRDALSWPFLASWAIGAQVAQHDVMGRMAKISSLAWLPATFTQVQGLLKAVCAPQIGGCSPGRNVRLSHVLESALGEWTEFELKFSGS